MKKGGEHNGENNGNMFKSNSRVNKKLIKIAENFLVDLSRVVLVDIFLTIAHTVYSMQHTA